MHSFSGLPLYMNLQWAQAYACDYAQQPFALSRTAIEAPAEGRSTEKALQIPAPPPKAKGSGDDVDSEGRDFLQPNASALAQSQTTAVAKRSHHSCRDKRLGEWSR